MLNHLLISVAARTRTRRDERGASATEYGLLLAGIVALVVVIVFAYGDSIRDL
jgi:pilus assembly protein Flp/PilA